MILCVICGKEMTRVVVVGSRGGGGGGKKAAQCLTFVLRKACSESFRCVRVNGARLPCACVSGGRVT